MTVATALRTVEILSFRPSSGRGARMFEALLATGQGRSVTSTTTYRGGADLLMLWGPGAPDRLGPMRAHVAAGGHVVAWDLAYWSRDTKIRCAIDGAHPQAWVLRRDWPASRYLADPPITADQWNLTGPVIIAGLGGKAKVQYGADRVQAWELEMIRQCRARGRRVLYRRKRETDVPPPGVAMAPDGPIERVLAGASLLVTWHSNVAVDAIRLGIPVVCRDGAAAAVCPSTLPDTVVPLAPTVRDRFLHNLAWFQWAPSEASACWAWLDEVLA